MERFFSRQEANSIDSRHQAPEGGVRCMGFSSRVHGNQAAGAREAKLWSVKAVGPNSIDCGRPKNRPK